MMIEHRTFGDRRKRPRIKSYAVLVLLLLGVGVWMWYHSSLGPVDEHDTSRVQVTVPTGASLSTIAADLEEQSVIRSSVAFAWHARWAKMDRLLRAGTYVLQPSMSVDEVLAVLAGGVTAEVSITIPEGFTVADIDRLMASKGFTQTGAILACSRTCAFDEFPFLPGESDAPGGRAEGFLFPDTYFVGGEGSDAEAFLTRLLRTFEAKVFVPLHPQMERQVLPIQDVITMASLIEEEAANDEERPIIAGILWKRLNHGITLGVDASIRYAVGKPTQALTQADLQSSSPYNTRVHQGLPPGPITNPGLASIQAALDPEESPYYYYLHGSDGQIHYAVTNDEHNANRARYLQ